jgi:CRP-like cAMP-binding protein
MEFPIYLLNKVKPMSASLKQSLCNHLHHKTAPKGEIICKEGEPCNHILFIRKGRVRYFNYTKGAEVFLGFRNAGDLIFPETCLSDHGLCRYNIQATKDCEYWSIQVRDYLDLYEEYAEFRELDVLLEDRCQLLEEQDFLARII